MDFPPPEGLAQWWGVLIQGAHGQGEASCPAPPRVLAAVQRGGLALVVSADRLPGAAPEADGMRH